MFIRRFFSTLVLAEHSNLKLSPLVGPALNASEYFNEKISVLVVGHNCDSVVSEVSKLKGVSKVYLASSPDLEHQQADAVARILKSLQSTHNFKRILASSSNFSRDVICRLGGALEVQPITEIIKIVNADTYKRAAYAGNAIYTVSTAQSLRLLTVRATAFDKTPASPSACPVEKLPVDGIKSLMAWIGEDIEKQTRPELTAAKIVVSGGRGLKNKEGFRLAEELGDCLGAAVGASRAAVDAHYCHNELQVGQTGKIVAPDLYVAIGISGAIQHLAGMKDSKVIVAINNDPEAPIFAVSDYALVADAFKAVPELIAKLKK